MEAKAGLSQPRKIRNVDTVEWRLSAAYQGMFSHDNQEWFSDQTVGVRKLTPRECERLQSFPDDWTLVPTKNGNPMADLPRYKAIGNSMTVPVMAFLGERLMASDCGRLAELNRRGRTRFVAGYPGNPKAEGYAITGLGLYEKKYLCSGHRREMQVEEAKL